ncbi:FlgD immunoglobulin-like domain containing protein [Escherichia coli]
MGAQTAGVHTYTWDGKQDDGSAAPDGAYNITFLQPVREPRRWWFSRCRLLFSLA